MRPSRALALGAGTALAAGAASLLAVGAVEAVAARALLTPKRTKTEDVRILDWDGRAATLRLEGTEDALLPGRYGFWFSDGAGYALLGPIVDGDAHSVTRRVESVRRGDLRTARRGRVSGWLHLAPEDLGLPVRSVRISAEVGDLPAWLFGAARDRGSWAIHLHGWSAERGETLRGVPVFAAQGWTSLVPAYRNDPGAPASEDGRLGLGGTEWRDAESAIRYALEHGARRIVLVGWSMGGAIALQTVLRSELAEHVCGLVLESPVIDWEDTLVQQLALRRLPAFLAPGAARLLASRVSPLLTGQSRPYGPDVLSLLPSAESLTTPALILHSDDDGFVPSRGSHALAAARPDIVRLEVFSGARHTKLWNAEPERWDAVVGAWIAALG